MKEVFVDCGRLNWVSGDLGRFRAIYEGSRRFRKVQGDLGRLREIAGKG